MKTTRRLILIITASVLLSLLTTTAFAGITAEPDKKATLDFRFEGIFGIDGSFEYSNRELFSAVSYKNSSSLMGKVASDRAFLYGFEETDVSILVTVTIDSSAQPGDSCTVTFRYRISDENGHMSDWQYASQTVVVKEPEPSSEPSEESSEPPPPPPPPPPVSKEESSKDESSQTVSEVEESSMDESKGEESETSKPGVDLTELLRLIKIAKGLNEDEYTADSWEELLKALTRAEDKRFRKLQRDVDASAAALAAAIDGLVKLDFSALDAAVREAENLDEACAHGYLWKELSDLLARVPEVRASRDQGKIDDLAAALTSLIGRIRTDCPDCGSGSGEVSVEVSVVEKEVIREVEAPLPDEFCNIPIHKVWPILFFVSLGINLVLGFLLFAFWLGKKKREDENGKPEGNPGDEDPVEVPTEPQEEPFEELKETDPVEPETAGESDKANAANEPKEADDADKTN